MVHSGFRFWSVQPMFVRLDNVAAPFCVLRRFIKVLCFNVFETSVLDMFLNNNAIKPAVVTFWLCFIAFAYAYCVT